MSEDILLLRQIPKVDEVLGIPEIVNLMTDYPRDLILGAVRETLNAIRQQIIDGRVKIEDKKDLFNQSMILRQVVARLDLITKPKLRKVINATGVVLHTNLGRAVLSPTAINAVKMAASGYSNLELDLSGGTRGTRYAPMEELLTRLTGASSSLAVNNNAAAVLLALSALAKGKEVIVSRGQLVEIGGSFRIPEVMEQSGAILREVGATNKTHPSDYIKAINENTALLLHVHTSNYKIVGFSRETTIKELVGIGREAGIPVMCDLGSGSFLEMEQFGLPGEITVQQAVGDGADVITFSGDKLMGGPQSGVIVGKKDLIEQIKRNPLTRAVRIDKLTVAALEATLREYLDIGSAIESIPTLQMLTADYKKLELKARVLNQLLTDRIGKFAAITIERGQSAVGGGAMPTADLPSWQVVIKPYTINVADLTCRLRTGKLAVLGIIRDNCLLLDVRTLLQDQERELADAVAAAFDGE